MVGWERAGSASAHGDLPSQRSLVAFTMDMVLPVEERLSTTLVKRPEVDR